MAALQISIPIAEIRNRMRQRIAGSPTNPRVVWQDGTQRVLIHADSLKVRAANGWLLCHLELETDITKRQRLQIVYFLGRDAEGDGPAASVTVNAPTAGSAQLAEKWGRDLQRVLWDAVLDGIEAGLQLAREQSKAAVKLLGFICSNEDLQVRVLTGTV
jgi:hypothetical protein